MGTYLGKRIKSLAVEISKIIELNKIFDFYFKVKKFRFIEPIESSSTFDEI